MSDSLTTEVKVKTGKGGVKDATVPGAVKRIAKVCRDAAILACEQELKANPDLVKEFSCKEDTYSSLIFSGLGHAVSDMVISIATDSYMKAILLDLPQKEAWDSSVRLIEKSASLAEVTKLNFSELVKGVATKEDVDRFFAKMGVRAKVVRNDKPKQDP